MNTENGTRAGASCSYASLGTYNMGSLGGINPPCLATTIPSMANQVVPNYQAPSYNTLVGTGSCNGYSGITNAYSKYTTTNGQCTSYVPRPCQGSFGY